MNTAFYLALDRLPMSLVAAIEFVGTIGVARCRPAHCAPSGGARAAVLGVFLLINVRSSSDPIGLFWAFLNGTLFVGYIVLGHKISEAGASGGVERLARRWRSRSSSSSPSDFGRLWPRSETQFWCSPEPASESAHP